MRAILAFLALAGLLTVPTTPARAEPQWSDVLRVQAEVNARVTYVAEPEGHDVWVPAYLFGDCEDFALAKREELIHLGFSPASLDVLFLVLPKGSGHVVLLVTFPGHGQSVLDMVDQPEPLLQYMIRTRAQAFCVARDLRPIDKMASTRC